MRGRRPAINSRHHVTGGPPPSKARIFGWGRPHTAKIGGNYAANYGSAGQAFPYPQAISVTDAVFIATGGTATFLITSNGEVWHSGNGEGAGGVIGRNDVVHTMPVGKLINIPSQEWERVYGNTDGHGNPLPLYLEENHANQTWITRRGPYGPALPTAEDVKKGRIVNGVVATWTVAAIAVCSPLVLMLTTDGRVLAGGGGNQNGAHGGGQAYTNQKPGSEQAANSYPQSTPFWVLTGAPIQSETEFNDHGVQLVSGTPGTTSQVWAYDKDSDPTWGNGTRANVLGNGPEGKVLAISAVTRSSWFLMKSGKVFYAGGGGGGHGEPKESLFAKEDALWTPTGGNLPTAIAGTERSYLLLLANGEIRFVGHNIEGMAGNGIAEVLPESTREVATPIFAETELPVKNVQAIASGDSSYKILLKDGTVWTTGSNFEYQQGLGSGVGTWAEKFTPTRRYTKIENCLNYKGELESLYAGGRKVVWISGGGEFTHEKTPDKRQEGGVNGGDCYIFVLSDGTIRTLGLNWEYANIATSQRYETWGVSGHGDSQNYSIPVEPIGESGNTNLTGITMAFNGPNSMFVLQPGGSPGKDTLTASTSGTTMTVAWEVPGEGETGKMPFWREAGGWTVKLEGANGPDKIGVKKGEAGATGTVHKFALAGAIRSQSFTGLQRGTYYQITCTENLEIQCWNPVASKWELAPKPEKVPFGAVNESGGKVTVAWGALPQPEPAGILEVRRAEASVSESEHDMPLAAEVKAGVAATSLPITAPITLTVKTPVVIWDGTNIQTCVVSLKTSAGTTPVPVEPFTPLVTFAPGTLVFKGGAKLTAPLTAGEPITSIQAVVGQTFAAGDTIVIQNGKNQDTCQVALKHTAKAGQTEILVESGVEGEIEGEILPLELEHSYPVLGTTIFIGKIEKWKRCVPDLTPAELTAGTATRAVPESQYGLTGAEMLWRLMGGYEPTYGTRQRMHIVPGIYRNEVGGLDAVSAKIGQTGTRQIVALGVNPSGGYSLSGAPAGMTIDDKGLISYTGGATAESKVVTVKAEGKDDVGGAWTDSSTFVWTVA